MTRTAGSGTDGAMTLVSRVLRHRTWELAVWVLVPIAPVVFLWCASLMGTGAMSVRAGLAVGDGFAALVLAALLVRLALMLPSGSCRGAGFLGLGVLVGGGGLLAAEQVPVAWSARTLALGFVCSATLQLLGLLLLPGTVPTWRARLRRALDGFGVGSCLVFAGWLLVIVPLAGNGPGPAGPRAMLAMAVGLVSTIALSIVGLVVVRAYRYRRASLLCAFGISLSLTGQAALVLLLLLNARPPVLATVGFALVAGPILAWLGAQRAGMAPGQQHQPADTDTTLATFPLLSFPVLLVAAGVFYHMITAGGFGVYSAMLGVVVAASVAAREGLAVFDVRRYAAELKTQETRFRSIVSGSSDVTVMLDEDLTTTWQSPSAGRQFGLSDQEVLGKPFASMFHPVDATEVTAQLKSLLSTCPARPLLVSARLRDGFGGYRYTESTVSDHRTEPAVAGLVVHIRDVGERREMEGTLHRMTFADQLTGLPNRRALVRALTELTGRRDPTTHRGALLIIDLDGLKAINNVFGHEAGDAVLTEVARRLRTNLPPDHLVARLGGDEFAVLTLKSATAAHAIGTRLLTALAAPFAVADSRMFLSGAIGIAEVTIGRTPDELVRGAEVATNKAKQAGRNRIERYDETAELDVMRRSMLEDELPGAIERGELDLMFQPIIGMAGKSRPVGAEALLRWRHPELKTVPPSEFVPLAEQTGLIQRIGSWALHQACRRLAEWLADGRDVWVSVNVSARQLRLPTFVSEVDGILKAHQVPADRLMIEVSEEAITEDVQRAVNQLAGLRQLGVRTAIDDFGSVLASLTQLRRLPVDVLKVDQALIGQPARNGRPVDPLADVTVSLGHRLGLQVVAEGVETAEQLSVLHKANCEYAQGHLFSRALPVEHIEAYFDSYVDQSETHTDGSVA